MDKVKEIKLKKIATKVRMNALTGVYHAKSGHPGGSLSISDILAYLYFSEMNVDVKNPKMELRDRFVLSKGHCAPALYGVLAEKGFFPVAEMVNLRQISSFLQGHPDMKSVPGVDMTTGSLGQGICAANGMALNAKLKGLDYRVYAIIGDGELQEGQVWEAAMFAPHYKLDNLVAVLDLNGLQIDGNVKDVMNVYPVVEKFKAFNWHVIEIDAHNLNEIESAYEEAKTVKGKPTMIVAKSIKGKGVSFMENQAGWHGAAPNDEQFKIAMDELNETLNKLEETV